MLSVFGQWSYHQTAFGLSRVWQSCRAIDTCFHQLWLSTEHHMRFSIIASGWGVSRPKSVNTSLAETRLVFSRRETYGFPRFGHWNLSTDSETRGAVCINYDFVCHMLSLPVATCRMLSLPVATCRMLSLHGVTCRMLSLPVGTCHMLSLPVVTCHMISLPVPYAQLTCAICSAYLWLPAICSAYLWLPVVCSAYLW